jgi:2-polyprenyl-3-methyl-5-hydroxy-6-metoxy-1,4-benzoquinol methylase
MHYDPIKKYLNRFFNSSPQLRILFYKLLDMLLLRTWYIKREIRNWKLEAGKRKPETGNSNVEILDAGSGFGQYSYYLSTLNKFWKILGVDIWEDHIHDCNNFFVRLKKENISFRIADLTRYIEKEKFNLIITIDVMEHILEDEKVFRNFNMSLKQGGMLLVSTPSDKGGSEAHSESDKSFIEEHVRNGYNIEDIKTKLQNAGFRDIYAKYSYGTPGHISWLLSMKLPILMLGSSRIFFIVLPLYYLLTYPFCLVLNFIDYSFTHKSGTGLIVKAYK